MRETKGSYLEESSNTFLSPFKLREEGQSGGGQEEALVRCWGPRSLLEQKIWICQIEGQGFTLGPIVGGGKTDIVLKVWLCLLFPGE